MRKKAVYYEDARGRRPVEEFIEKFDDKTKGKILFRIEYLAEHWHEIRRPYVDKIDGALYELRVDFAWNNVRVIYAYVLKEHIILLHGFRKKTGRIRESDKVIARNRLADFEVRYARGEITVK